VRGTPGAITSLRHASAETELLDAPRIVELIVAVGYNQVRNTRFDGLRQRADTSVIHE